MSGRRGQLSGTLRTTVFSYSALIANAVSGAMLARALGPAGRGLVAALVVISGVTHVLCTVGMPHAMAHFIASGGNRASACVYARGLMRRQVAANVVVNVLTLTVFALGERHLEEVATFLLWAPGMTATVYGTLFAQADGNLTRMNLLRSGPSFLALAAQLPLFLAGALTPKAVGLSYTLATVLTGLVSYHMLVATGDPLPLEVRSRLWAYGRRNLLALLASAANGRVDQLVLAFAAASATLGLYSVATAAASAAIPVCTSLSAVAFKRLASSSAGGQGWAAAKGLLWTTFFLSFAWALVFVPLATWLMPAVYGPGFQNSVSAARVLAIGSVATALLYVLTEIGRATGAVTHLSLAEGLGALMTAAGITVVVVWLGSDLASLAVASSLGYLGAAGFLFVAIRRTLTHAP